MGEKRSQLLPDLDAYLERIGVEGAKEPSPGFLDELIDAHQRTVPFENIGVYMRHESPSLEIPDMFDKIVTRKQGGYCFELNALFGALLQDLGFRARPCMCRVIFRPSLRDIVSHRANIVTIDGKDYLADVGFGGPMPNFALVLEDGASRTELGQTFTVRIFDDYWWDVCYARDGQEAQTVLRACVMPVGEKDFIPFSFHQSQDPQSPFRLNLMANIRTKEGAINLRNKTLTEHRNGEKTVTELESEKDVERILWERFGLRQFSKA